CGPGGLVATASYGGVVTIRSAPACPDPIRQGRGHERPINDLAFHADGRLVSASNDGTAAVWRIEEVAAPGPCRPGGGEQPFRPDLYCACFCGESRIAAADSSRLNRWGNDGSVFAWEVDGGAAPVWQGSGYDDE